LVVMAVAIMAAAAAVLLRWGEVEGRIRSVPCACGGVNGWEGESDHH
jgi:hypothetical protein